MSLIIIILIAISLSMDAFSLSLAYGTLGMKKKDKILLSFITGAFHFVMPLLGLFIGKFILKFIKINPNIIVSFILSFIGIDMIISSFKNDDVKIMKVYEYFLFALAVSIDSFSIGITFNNIDNYILNSLIISISSFIFTFLGLSLGSQAEKILGKVSTIIGGLTLTAIGLCFLK